MRSLAKAVGVIGSANVMGALLGLIYLATVARYYGTSRSAETFFAAAVIEEIVLRLVQLGQLGEVFVPSYLDLKARHSRKAAVELFWAMMAQVVLLGTVFCVGTFAAAEKLAAMVVPGFDPEARAITAAMIRGLSFLPILHIVAGMTGHLANAERRFGVAEWSAVAGRAVAIGVVALCSDALGPWALVAASWASGAVTVASVVIGIGAGRLAPVRVTGSAWRNGVVWRGLGGAGVYSAATQIYAFALSAGFSLLPEGAYGAFQYASRIVSKIQGLALRPFRVVILTEFSDRMGEKGGGDARLFGLGVVSAAVVAGLVAAPLSVASVPGARLLFYGDPEAGSLTAGVLQVLCLMLLPQAVGIVYRTLVMARGGAAPFYLAAAVVQIASALVARLVIPHMHLDGAVTLVFLLDIVLLAVPVAALRSRLRGRHDPGRLRTAVVFGILVVGGSYGAGKVIGLAHGNANWLSDLVLLTGAGSVGLGLVILCMQVFPEFRGTRMFRMLRSRSA